MITAEKTVERLTQHAGLEQIPAAERAIEQAKTKLAALEEQGGRLLPKVLAQEREVIMAAALEDVTAAYDREQAARLKSLESERGRALVETAGVETMPQGAAERRALDVQWAAEVPALLAALPHITDVAELEDIADVAFVRQSSLLIRALVPAVLTRLNALEAERSYVALSSQFAEWRRANPTHRQRMNAIASKEHAITSGLTSSRDMLLTAHGFKAPTWN